MKNEVALPVSILASPLHEDAPARVAPPLLQDVRERHGVRLEPVSADNPRHLTVLLLLTGGTERPALELADQAPGPVVMLCHGAHNSLPAGLEATAALQARGRRTRLIQLGGSGAADDLRVIARAAALADAFARQRVGLIGQPSPWLVASSPPPDAVAGLLGCSIEGIALGEVLSRLDGDPSEPPPGELEGVDESDRRMGGRVRDALLKLAGDRRLTALSIACFGLLPHGMTACWALADLADRGIPAGCEGDLPSLLALIAAQELTGRPGFLANPAEIDAGAGRVLLAHCTVPLSLLTSHRLRTHFESGLGLAVEGTLKPGPYTLVRFGGRRLEEAFFAEGAVLDERVGREDLCRTQAVFSLPGSAAARILERPLGNHHVLISGHHRRVLREYHDLFLAGRPDT